MMGFNNLYINLSSRVVSAGVTETSIYYLRWNITRKFYNTVSLLLLVLLLLLLLLIVHTSYCCQTLMSEHSFDGLILSKTVRDLHTLSTFNGSKQEYEGLLRATIANIVRLLSYDSKLYRYLQLSSHYVQDSNRQTVLLDVLFLFYVNKSQTQPNVSKQSLLQHLKAYNQKSHESINLQLIELLAANSAAAAASSLPLSSTSGLRLSSSYSVVLTKFSSLLDHFIRLHRESERKLVEYINECFNYELLFFSTLRSRLDSDIDINDEDTHQIVQSLDNIIGISPHRWINLKIVCLLSRRSQTLNILELRIPGLQATIPLSQSFINSSYNYAPLSTSKDPLLLSVVLWTSESTLGL